MLTILKGLRIGQSVRAYPFKQVNESLPLPGSPNEIVRIHRFTLRSKLKVDVQWTRTRFALVHNIGKIHTYGAVH